MTRSLNMPVHMPSETLSLDIHAPARRVFDILTNPAAMPSWTNGFVSSARVDDGVWILQTVRGVLHWRIATNTTWMSVDFYTESQHPDRATYARVLPRGAGSVVVFTMIQWPDINAERFAQMKHALAAELTAVKALAEDTLLPSR